MYLEPTTFHLPSEWQAVDLMPEMYVERRPIIRAKNRQSKGARPSYWGKT